MIRWIVAVSLLTFCVLPLHARPAHKQALVQYFGPSFPKNLANCNTCHLPGGTEEDKPHNLFGERLAAVKFELRKADKATTFEARLEALFKEDTDKDGANNLVELLTGHSPGDPKDRPSVGEADEGKQRAADFERRKKGYAWKPFEPVQRPAVPTPKSTQGVRNPVDAFLRAEQEAVGLTARPEATPEVLLRRVYLDLVGLPPTAEELRAFLKDTSPEAFERVVDRLLADKKYGERWGRHWMDIWRYSDWAGFGAQIRDSQPHIWRWRDWIIDSLNADTRYDRMVQEMLAGDELAPEDPQALIATGYLVRNWKLLSREKWIQDTVEHTSMAFLGLTVQCAKCHDHMYDPISQAEYYHLRAIFEPHSVRIDRVPGEADTKKAGIARAFDKELAAPTYLFVRGDDRTPDKSKTIPPLAFEALGNLWSKVDPVSLPPGAYSPDARPFILQDDIDAAKKDVVKSKESLEQLQKKPGKPEEIRVAELDRDLMQARLEALVKRQLAEDLERKGEKGEPWKQAAIAVTQAQRKAALFDATKKRQLAENLLKAETAAAKIDAQKKALADAEKALAKLTEDHKAPATVAYAKPTVAAFPQQSTGRRLAFARWLTDRKNPLTARVAVNHLWARHFGQGIVPTTHDFGRNGRPASHPALLDWLAYEFMEQGWSMKKIHRLMVTSAAYRQASTTDEASLKRDPDNKYYWRFAPRRLEAEAIRDAVFHVAGQLDLTMGGPELDFPLGATVPRRSVYFRHAAEKQMEFMQIFDGPSVTECYERRPSIIPQQALALLNNEMALKNARLLARRLAKDASTDDVFVTAAFEQVLSRGPSQEERTECVTFLKEQPGRFDKGTAEPALRAKENLVHVLMNHHEFVTLR